MTPPEQSDSYDDLRSETIELAGKLLDAQDADEYWERCLKLASAAREFADFLRAHDFPAEQIGAAIGAAMGGAISLGVRDE